MAAAGVELHPGRMGKGECVTTFTEQVENYRARLFELEQQMQISYDKAVMTLSGGALGVSLTFIRDIADKTALHASGWLLAAWLCWGVSVTCVLFSFFSSSLALRRAARQTDERTIYLEAVGGGWNCATMILNPLAGVLFLFGVVSICVFVGRNIP